ncbi:hypothetical protein [Lactiplantibacillus daowaiensis]|uniref:Uncharacterized protein n=1 Tax=Lactiplantibacillus daowaiensis TaxID=2559918 RepID=A0ABW1RWE9_9LACO|nr:hypothetical protein [Lactiplantibacillus daowaiensis]
MRYFIGVIALIFVLSLVIGGIVKKVRHQPIKHGWQQVATVVFSLVVVMWGLGDTRLTYGTVPITAEQRSDIKELTSTENKIYTLMDYRRKVSLIKAGTEELRQLDLKINGNTKIEKALVDSNVEAINLHAFSRMGNHSALMVADVLGILKINRRVAKKISSDSEKAQLIFDQLQTDAGMDKFKINSFEKK